MHGIERVRKPYEGCLDCLRDLSRRASSGQASADRYSEAHVAAVLRNRPPLSAREDAGRNLREGVRPACLGRANPRGASGGRQRSSRGRRKGRSDGSIPGSRGRSRRPAVSTAGAVIGETACGAVGRGNAAAPVRAEKAPKGESHERRRHEIEPARDRREQTAERATKP